MVEEEESLESSWARMQASTTAKKLDIQYLSTQRRSTTEVVDPDSSGSQCRNRTCF